jgi:beta-lactamase superfamily II metal-dependent hydrolase
VHEMDFLPVGDGNGDAICVRYGSEEQGYWLHVIDGGFSDTADTVIAHIENYYGKNYHINHMVLSHADNDHACGLIGVLKRFDVKGSLWMNRPWRYAAEVLPHFHGSYTLEGLTKKIRDMHPYLVELEEIAAKNGIEVKDAFQGSQIGQFTVLAPSQARYINLIPDLDKTPTSYRDAQGGLLGGGILGEVMKSVRSWIDETWDIETLSNDPDPPTSASNETSLVQLGIIDGKRLLLTGDVGPRGLDEAASYAELLGSLAPPDFFQVPHHGSRRNVTPSVLDRWLGTRKPKGTKIGTAFCSVGKEQTDYPRGQVKNALYRRGYPIHVTRGNAKSYFHPTQSRPGWGPSQPEPFEDRVQA